VSLARRRARLLLVPLRRFPRRLFSTNVLNALAPRVMARRDGAITLAGHQPGGRLQRQQAGDRRHHQPQQETGLALGAPHRGTSAVKRFDGIGEHRRRCRGAALRPDERLDEPLAALRLNGIGGQRGVELRRVLAQRPGNVQ
jgi:hypothetical protein